MSIDVVEVPRPKKFVDAWDAYFNGILLPKFVERGLNKQSLVEIRKDVDEKVRYLIGRSSLDTSDDFVKWLSEQLFMSIEVNGLRLDAIPGVSQAFSSGAKLERASTTELRLWRGILDDTALGDAIQTELDRRS